MVPLHISTLLGFSILTITMVPLHISILLGFSIPATAASSILFGRLKPIIRIEIRNLLVVRLRFRSAFVHVVVIPRLFHFPRHPLGVGGGLVLLSWLQLVQPTPWGVGLHEPHDRLVIPRQFTLFKVCLHPLHRGIDFLPHPKLAPEFSSISTDELVFRAIQCIGGAGVLVPFARSDVQRLVRHDFDHDVHYLFPR